MKASILVSVQLFTTFSLRTSHKCTTRQIGQEAFVYNGYVIGCRGMDWTKTDVSVVRSTRTLNTFQFRILRALPQLRLPDFTECTTKRLYITIKFVTSKLLSLISEQINPKELYLCMCFRLKDLTMLSNIRRVKRMDWKVEAFHGDTWGLTQFLFRMPSVMLSALYSVYFY